MWFLNNFCTNFRYIIRIELDLLPNVLTFRFRFTVYIYTIIFFSIFVKFFGITVYSSMIIKMIHNKTFNDTF